MLPHNPCGWGNDSAKGKAINIVSSGAVRVAGAITYQRVGGV
jgi:hypothetical protein